MTLTDIVDGHNLDKGSPWGQLFNYFVQRNRVIVYPQKNIEHNLKSQEMLNTVTFFCINNSHHHQRRSWNRWRHRRCCRCLRPRCRLEVIDTSRNSNGNNRNRVRQHLILFFFSSFFRFKRDLNTVTDGRELSEKKGAGGRGGGRRRLPNMK